MKNYLKLITSTIILLINSTSFSQDISKLLEEALEKQNSGDLVGALKLYNEYIEKYNNPWPGYSNRGNVYFSQGKYIEAIGDYTVAIKMLEGYDQINEDIANSVLHVIYDNRGQAKIHLDDNRGAIMDFDKALSRNSEYIISLYHRGLARINIGKKDEGCIDLSSAGERGYTKAYEAIKMLCK